MPSKPEVVSSLHPYPVRDDCLNSSTVVAKVSIGYCCDSCTIRARYSHCCRKSNFHRRTPSSDFDFDSLYTERRQASCRTTYSSKWSSNTYYSESNRVSLTFIFEERSRANFPIYAHRTRATPPTAMDIEKLATAVPVAR
jgi:hypothetical protein